MKRLKPMNKQMSLSLGPEPSICGTSVDLPPQQQEEIQSVLADLLLTAAINSTEVRRGGDINE